MAERGRWAGGLGEIFGTVVRGFWTDGLSGIIAAYGAVNRDR
jgi:hypothetical protein